MHKRAITIKGYISTKTSMTVHTVCTKKLEYKPCDFLKISMIFKRFFCAKLLITLENPNFFSFMLSTCTSFEVILPRSKKTRNNRGVSI